MLESILQDLRYAARSLARTPVLTVAAVLTLGLGIGANSAMFGIVGALIAGRALASLLYGVSPHDPVVLAIVAAVLVFVATLASYFPALRATRADPMVALRYE